MSSRRGLVSRQQRDAPLSVRRPRPSEAQSHQLPPLPPYEPPSCPLTEAAKRLLVDLASTDDCKKYEKHIKASIQKITECAAESNDKLYESKESLRKLVEKREAAGDDKEKTKEEERAEERVKELEEKVNKLTADSEAALRDLIDYSNELSNQKEMMKNVTEAAVAASVMGMSSTAGSRTGTSGESQRKRANRSTSDDDNDDEEIEEEPDEADATIPASILSLTELLEKAKDDYSTEYNSKTMRARYADHNDYKNFRRVIHDARHPGDNAPPVPHSSTWFPSENANVPSNPAAARRRRLATTTDNTENGDDDEDIQITGSVSSLRCPITLQLFKEPYSNRKCPHTFEKSAILQLHRDNAVAFADPAQGRRGRGVPQGPRQLKCPEASCEAMLELDDFYENQLILRQVKRREAQAALEMEEDEIEVGDNEDDGYQTRRASMVKPEGADSGPSQGTLCENQKETSSNDGLEVLKMEE